MQVTCINKDAGGETAIIETPLHRPGPVLMFYIGGAVEARTRLALAKVSATPKSLVVVARAGSAAAFAAQYRQSFSTSHPENIVPLFGPRRPRIIDLASGPRAILDAKDFDRIFFESLEARPADIISALAVATSLSRLSLEKSATVLAGLFAATDAEALLFEQGLIDFGIARESVVAGWLNGFGNASIRYVRVLAEALMDQGLRDLMDTAQDTGRVIDFNIRTSMKGTRL